MKASIFSIALIAAFSFASCQEDEKPCATNDTAMLAREDSLNKWEQSLVLRERALAEQLSASGGVTSNGGDNTATNNEPVQSLSKSAVASHSANSRPGGSSNITDPKVAYKKSKSSNPGQYPEASERLLTEKDVQYQTAWGKKIMLNEIYARKGLIFKDDALKKHFARESWYKGRRASVTPKMLTSIEKQNIAFMEAHQ